MTPDTFSIFRRGLEFARNNPQLWYTLSLLVLIPAGFIYVSQTFLGTATQNQERLERSRIGLLHDVFVSFTADRMDDRQFLLDRIRSVAGQNVAITDFRVVDARGKEPLVIASLRDEDIGESYPADDFLLRQAAADQANTYLTEYMEGGIRYFRAARAIIGAQTSPIGYAVTTVSMESFDSLAQAGIFRAYAVLAVIILFIFLLLMRQARVLDYAALYRRLKEVDEMKDSFVSMAAHELRTPLAVIKGYVNLLGTRVKDPSEEVKHMFGGINTYADQLDTLVADILDVARLQEGRMKFEAQLLDPAEHIAMVAQALAPTAEAKGLKLIYESKPLPRLRLDPDRFRQVMLNLVGNAVKYTLQGEVRVSAAEENGRVAIRVSDTGIGISAEDQNKLFQKFYRVKSEEVAQISGTGLGLWITWTIVKRMNGSISVESIRHKGTDFILSFPIPK